MVPDRNRALLVAKLQLDLDFTAGGCVADGIAENVVAGRRSSSRSPVTTTG